MVLFSARSGSILCKEFTELNGREIWFNSRTAHGTTFHFTFQAEYYSANLTSHLLISLIKQAS